MARHPNGSETDRPAAELSAAVAPSLLREMNQRLLLDLLFTGGPATRPDLARAAGLSQPTVIAALDDLERAGLALSSGSPAKPLGRPAKVYEADARAGSVAGIDIGRDWLHLSVTDLAGRNLADLDVRNSAKTAAGLVELAAHSLAELTDKARIRPDEVTHTVIGSPGVLDPRRGGVRYAANLPGWHRAGLAHALTEKLGPSLSIDNDANLAALAELNYGAARGVRDFVYVTVGTGVGIGLVLDGRVYRGFTGAAGEIGYLPLGNDGAGPRGTLPARGMLEEAVAADAIVRNAKASGMSGSLTAKTVFAAARSGDRRALAAVAIEGSRLAQLIASIAAFLDPELIVMGGGVGQNLDLLKPEISASLATLTPMRPTLISGQLGRDAVVRGAIARGVVLAREAVFAARLA